MAAGVDLATATAVASSARVARTSAPGGGHSGEDGGLDWGFALCVDDFGEAGPEGAMVIDAGEAEVFS